MEILIENRLKFQSVLALMSKMYKVILCGCLITEKESSCGEIHTDFILRILSAKCTF